MKDIETVATHCHHNDCVYRRPFAGTTECCMYAVIMHEKRNCKISECDKYKRGTKKARTTIEQYIEWDITYEDDNF